MKFLSVCSGIEAASVAWRQLGWEAVAFSEIEPFPCAVLAHHYPGVPNWGDMTRFKEWPDAAIDVLVGGTPCQSFSVAGLRKGLDDPRGNLALTYLAILDRYRPRWCCWENVPGVLSSGGGRDFGAFLGGLGQLGYGFAYRVLDAQYFGLAQRRKRVFVVGHLGDWRRAAAVLFERESLSGHPAPSREAGQRIADSLTVGANQCSGTRSDFVEHDVTGTLSSRTSAGGGLGTDFDVSGGLIADIAPTLNASFGKKLGLENQHIDGGAGMFIAHAPRADGFDASEDGTGRGTPLVYQCQGSNVGEMGALRAGNGNETGMQVRRLTPRECARLQGFPDDYLDITYRGKPAADGNKYRALGNSMAVPVISWIGRRIQLVDSVPYPDQSEQPRDAEANTRPAQVSDGPARALEGTGTHGG